MEQNDITSSCFLVTGNDDFAIKAKARELAVMLGGSDYGENPAMEIIPGDSDERQLDEVVYELISSIQTPPFLTEQKIIWLKHYQGFQLGKSAGEAEKERVKSALGELTSLMKADVPADVSIIIDGPGLDRRSALYKVFNSKGAVHSLTKVDIGAKEFSKNHRKRIQQLCFDAGKKLDNDANRFLGETLSSDSGQLNNELAKLFCYIGDRETITIDDCRAVCSRTPEAVGWSFANALMEKSVKKALNAVDTLIAQMLGEKGNSSTRTELVMLFMAIKGFQNLIKVKKAAAELNVPARCSNNFFYRISQDKRDKYPNNMLLSCHPFRAFNLVNEAARFCDAELIEDMNALLQANRQLVSSGGDPRIVLEQLIIKICSSK